MYNLQALRFGIHYVKSILNKIKYMAKQLKNTEKAIQRLTGHLTNKGWTVVIGDPETRVITINERKPLKILWTMLHEAGHSIIFCLDDYNESFDEIGKQYDKNEKRRSRIFYYQRLKEEMMAWEVGLNLAKSLNIYVDHKAYDKYAAIYFMSYVHEASLGYYQRLATKIGDEAGFDISFENVV